MTGEVFGVLWRHSILGRLGGAETVNDEGAFDAGVDRSAHGQGLLHHLFGVRTRGLFQEIQVAGLASYLSGLLIGHEIRAAAPSAAVAVIGEAVLARLYRRAFARCGIDHLPVIQGEHGRGVTMISRAALLRAYQRELTQRT